jgi:hypothetical protein
MNDSLKIAGAPGLIWRRSKSGLVATWQCRTDLAQKGFAIKSQRILQCSDAPNTIERALIADRCTALQTEMLMFGRGGDGGNGGPVNNYDGTIEGLVRAYETHKASPFQTCRPETRATDRGRHLRIIKDHGNELISNIDLGTVTVWRQNWIDEIQLKLQTGNLRSGVPMANKLVDCVRVLLSFGANILKDQKCKEARLLLSESNFSKPRVNKKQKLTFQHVVAFCRIAHAMGHHAMALAQAIQFDTGMRQKDIIGEWQDIAEKTSPPSDVTHQGRKWVYGLRWNELREVGVMLVLEHDTSKRDKLFRGDMRVNELTMAELKALPQPLPASGPVIVQEATGLPYAASRYRKVWRAIAAKAGIPAEVKNRHSRHGAATEALATTDAAHKVQSLLGHSELKTTLGYDDGAFEATNEVMANRNKARKKG